MTDRPIALIADDIHKSFGALEVLKGISLTALEGDVISIIGSSGSGKSTLLRCINFLETPDKGRILLGGDHLGRDVLTRTLMGGREAILVSTMATGVAVLWGGLFGIFLAFAGRFVDEASMRMVDALLAIPWILFVMLFVAGLGTGMGVLIPILGISYGLSIVRIVRAAALDVVTRDFILAARARGERRSVVIVHEMLPNVLDTLAVQAAMTWSWGRSAGSATRA